MVSTALVACLLGAVCPARLDVVTAVPDIGASGYDFAMEIAGPAARRSLSMSEGAVQRVLSQDLPSGSRLEITFLRIAADAEGPAGFPMRIKADADVSIITGDAVQCSRARIVIGTQPTVAGDAGEPMSVILTPIPDTLVATSDAPNGTEVERDIASAASAIAGALSIPIHLETLSALAAARSADAPPLQTGVYQLGFEWVLRVAGPSVSSPATLPSVFLQGSVFTLVMSKAMVQQLADREFALGELPKALGTDGLPDPNGPTRVTAIGVDLEPGAMVLNWQGVGPGGRSTTVTWRLIFVASVAELALKLREVTVDGKVRRIPDAEGLVNPIDEMIKRVTPGPGAVSLLGGTLGRTRLTNGEIAPYGILVAGRV